MCSLIISFWVGFGAIFSPKPPRPSDPTLNTLLCNASGYDVNVTYATSMATSHSTFHINSTLEDIPPERLGPMERRCVGVVLDL